MHWRRLLLLEMVLRRRVHAWVRVVAGGRVRGGLRRQIPAVVVRVVLAVVVIAGWRWVMPVGVRVRLMIVGSTAGKTALHVVAAAAAAVNVAIRVAAAVGTSRRQRARLLVGGPTARSRRVAGSPRPGPDRAAPLAPPAACAARAPTARHTLGSGAAAAEGFFVSLLPEAELFLFRKTTKRGPT